MVYFSAQICTSNIRLYDFHAANIFVSLTLEISALLSMQRNCIQTTFAYVVWFGRLNPEMLLSKEQALCLLVNLLTSCALNTKKKEKVKFSPLEMYKNRFLFKYLNDIYRNFFLFLFSLSESCWYWKMKSNNKPPHEFPSFQGKLHFWWVSSGEIGKKQTESQSVCYLQTKLWSLSQQYSK